MSNLTCTARYVLGRNRQSVRLHNIKHLKHFKMAWQSKSEKTNDTRVGLDGFYLYMVSTAIKEIVLFHFEVIIEWVRSFINNELEVKNR